MKHVVETFWKKDLCFESHIEQHVVWMDAPAKEGMEVGPSPKKLMLSALAGCSGMDVVTILKKMRVDYSGLTIRVEGHVTEEHPKRYDAMHLVYEFTGLRVNLDKFEKAVALSLEKYCGVAAVYQRAMRLTHEVVVKE